MLFRSYAILHAVRVVNAWPTQLNKQGEFVSPLQKFHGENVKLEDIPLFVCHMTVPVPPDQPSMHTTKHKHTWNRGREGVFLGKGERVHMAGLLMLDLRDSKIRSVTPHGAKFLLNIMPLLGKQSEIHDLQQFRRQVMEEV